MIASLGIDSVEIARCAPWHTWSTRKLQRLFAPHEIAYCLQNPAKSSERFAAHFAAKEAFYKALHSIITNQKLPLFTVFAHIQVIKQNNGAPTLHVDWDYFMFATNDQLRSPLATHLTLTHTKSSATALVILEHKEIP